MSYTEAAATKFLATHCVSCGRPLVDAVSVEVGMGPECRNNIFPDDIDESDRKIANEHVYHAALAAQNGQVEKVLEYAKMIRELGFVELADKVERRFKSGFEYAKGNADITITKDGGWLIVHTPFRRGKKEDFVNAWRSIPGRYYDRKSCANRIPESQKNALWDVLKEFFPGKWGVGPKGVFRVPSNKG